MTTYNTIPTDPEEQTLLKQSKTPMKRIIASAAATAFILGCVAATAMSPTYTPKQTSLATSCDTTSQATCLTIYGCQWFNDNGDVGGNVGGCRNWGDNENVLAGWCGNAKDETSCNGMSVTFGNNDASKTGTCSWDGSQCKQEWFVDDDPNSCEDACGTVAGTCEGACGIAFFTEPECGIACGVAAGICAMACQQDDQPMPDVAPVADSTKFCADWRQAYDEKCQAANVTCKAVPDDYCPVAN